MRYPIRVFVFPSRPDSLLVHVDEEEPGPLVLPPIPTPFSKDGLSAALGGAEVRAKVSERAPGRWTSAMDEAEKSARAARHRRHQDRVLVESTIMLGSAEEVERERAALILAKREVDEEISSLKDKIRAAKADAFERGAYMPAGQFRALETKHREKVIAAQELAAKLSSYKEAARNGRERRSFLDRFFKEARSALDGETFKALCDAAQPEEEEGG